MGQSRALQIVLIVVGLIVLAAGIVYLTVPARSLPSFLGGIPRSGAHRSKRGFAGVVVGALCLLGALGLAMPRRSQT